MSSIKIRTMDKFINVSLTSFVSMTTIITVIWQHYHKRNHISLTSQFRHDGSQEETGAKS